MSINYLLLKEQLTKLNNTVNSSNFREIKSDLIELRAASHDADLTLDQKKEINLIFDECFEKVNTLYEKDKEEFQNESFKNRETLTPKVEEALINAKYAEDEDINDAWNFCIKVQQEFKGIRMEKEIRETLYSQLQEAFDLLKERREKKNLVKEKESLIIKEDLMPEIETLVQNAENASDISDLWQKLINYQKKVRESDLSYEVRNQLLNKLQDGFTILKIRREEEKSEFEANAKDNTKLVESLIAEGEDIAKNSENFKESFERLKQIQQTFRDYKLLKEDREALYQRLQNAFETIKQRQEDYFNFRNKEAIENYQRLKPMVLAAYERAQSSMEFKKTKEHLKRVQTEFKGIKMKAEEREELYKKLQASFDILHQRQDEYYAAKKDKIELHINYQVSDVDMKIEALQNEINKDYDIISSLSETESNPLLDEVSSDPAHDINNHIQILKAAIARKEAELDELKEQRESLMRKKDKWEDIE
ncbi:MAG: hypothetical protein ACOCWC_02015 [Bacteroidota bacterium]